MMNEVFVGVDVSKRYLDVAVRPSGEVCRIDLESRSVRDAVAAIKVHSPRLVVVEATGGYERGLVEALCADGIAVAVVNPRQVRDFARATGRLAKTDEIDSHVLAHFAEAMKPAAYQPPSSSLRKLTALVVRRRQLVAMATAEKSHVESSDKEKCVVRSIARLLRTLKTEIAKLDREIERIIRDTKHLQAQHEVLTSVPGVGDAIAATLLVELPEIGTLDRRKLAALSGVAPLNRDSGPRSAPRSCWGGRAAVRHALFMATIVGLRERGGNPYLRTHYRSLRARGKPGLVAVVACMRKLLTMLNAMLRDNAPFKKAPPSLSP
jgi:transposase